MMTKMMIFKFWRSKMRNLTSRAMLNVMLTTMMWISRMLMIQPINMNRQPTTRTSVGIHLGIVTIPDHCI